jgi:hypothetical protein
MLKAFLSAIVGLGLVVVLAIVNAFSRPRDIHGEETNPEGR